MLPSKDDIKNCPPELGAMFAASWAAEEIRKVFFPVEPVSPKALKLLVRSFERQFRNPTNKRGRPYEESIIEAFQRYRTGARGQKAFRDLTAQYWAERNTNGTFDLLSKAEKSKTFQSLMKAVLYWRGKEKAAKINAQKREAKRNAYWRNRRAPAALATPIPEATVPQPTVIA